MQKYDKMWIYMWWNIHFLGFLKLKYGNHKRNNKFTFNFDNLFIIYQKTNIILKKKNKISMISQGKTIIDIMANISYDVVEKLVNSKYK